MARACVIASLLLLPLACDAATDPAAKVDQPTSVEPPAPESAPPTKPEPAPDTKAPRKPEPLPEPVPLPVPDPPPTPDPADAEHPPDHPEPAERPAATPPPDLTPEPVVPTLRYPAREETRSDYGDKLWAPFISCADNLAAYGFPAVSTDGQFLVHRRRRADWATTWVAYADTDNERFDERHATIERIDGTGTPVELWLLRGVDPPHGPKGGLAGPEEVETRELDCKRLRRKLRPQIKRVNKALREYEWRAMHAAEDLGIRVIESSDALEWLESEGADRTPIELLLRKCELILRIKGVEVLHREPASSAADSTIAAMNVDLPTGLVSVLLEIDDGGEQRYTQDHVVFTLPPAVLAAIKARVATGLRVLDDER